MVIIKLLQRLIIRISVCPIPVRESRLVPLGRSKRILLWRTVPCPLVPVSMTMSAVVLGRRCRPVASREKVRHAAARPLHGRHCLGVEASGLTDVGNALEMSDGSSKFLLGPQSTCLQVGRRQIAELHQVHLPQNTRRH